MSEQRMARSDVWRLQYREQRYASHLSQPELDQRIRDVVLNVLTLAEGGIGIDAMNVTPDEISNESTAWNERFAHVLEEMELRHGPYPSGFTRDTVHREPLPDFTSELAKKAAKRLAAIGSKPGDVFIKFGKRHYMEQLHASGALRIQPATYFSKAIHNEAIKDDELTLTLSLVASREDLISLVGNPKDVPPDAPNRRVDVTFQLESDYWLYCVSGSVIPRLFVDYNADSCVIIRDRQKFAQLLRDASLQKLSGTRLCDSPVEYIDPLLPRSPSMPIAFSKHFRYSYQNEHRFCWFPPHPVKKAMHCDVQIGSLKDFSDLIVL